MDEFVYDGTPPVMSLAAIHSQPSHQLTTLGSQPLKIDIDPSTSEFSSRSYDNIPHTYIHSPGGPLEWVME